MEKAIIEGLICLRFKEKN